MPNVKQILAFDKENLLDILHYLSKEIAKATDLPDVRLYLEDMRGGALNCLYTPEGELERKGARIPIQMRNNALVKSYLESKILDGVVLGSGTDDLHMEWYARKKLVSSAIFPLLDAGRSIGVLSVDSSHDFGEVLTNRQYMYVSPANMMMSAIWIAAIIGIFAVLKRKKEQFNKSDEE